MELIRGLHNLRDKHRGCVATIGNFDGVHLGHQKVLQQVKQKAAEMGLPSVVIIFEPQPREFFAGSDAPPRLTRFDEKVRLLRDQGIDRVLCLTFNARLRSMSAQAFVDELLLNGLHVRHFVVGDDFRFGCDRTGDYAMLEATGAAHDFSVENTHTYLINEQRVSSTLVRETLMRGDFELAEQLLGRPYRVTGRVQHGNKLGRSWACLPPMCVCTASGARYRVSTRYGPAFAGMTLRLSVMSVSDRRLMAACRFWKYTCSIGIRISTGS